MAGILSVGLLALATVVDANPILGFTNPITTVFGRTCSQVGSHTQQGSYSINCGVDRPGGNMIILPQVSFTHCQSLCDTTWGAQGFVFDEVTKLCYIKNFLFPEVVASGFGAGIIPTTDNGYAQTAEQLGGDLATYKGYTIHCGQDRRGGDSFWEDGKSFSGCIDRCNSLADCVGLAFRSDQNRCYYKSSLGGGGLITDGGCYFAENPNKPKPTTTTTTTRTTTTTTTVPTTTTTTRAVTTTTTTVPTTTTTVPTTTTTTVPTTTTTTRAATTTTTTQAPVPTTTTTQVVVPTTTTTQVVVPTTTTTQVIVPTTTTTQVVVPTTTTVQTTTVQTTTVQTTTSAPAVTTSALTTTTTTVAQPSPSSCLAVAPQLGDYTVSCNTDFPGGDLSNQAASSFAACGPICDQTPGCIGFSYVGGNNPGVCYLKSSKVGNGTPNSGVSSGFKNTATPGGATTTTTAAATTSVAASTTTSAASIPSGACAGIGSGVVFAGGYTASCSTDFPGSFDSGNSPADSFAACAPLCDARSDCVGYSYVGGQNPGVCYFKSAQGTAQSNPSVDSAFKSRPAGTTSVASTTTVAATTTVPATTTQTATATATPAPSSGSCASLGSLPFGSGYVAECNTDRVGGDISNQHADSFAACAPLCDAIAGCIGYAFVGGQGAGQCYFKNNKRPANSTPSVDVAFKPSLDATITTTTVTVTQTPTTSAALTTKSPVYTCLCRDEL